MKNVELMKKKALKFDMEVNFGDSVKVALSEFHTSKVDTKHLTCTVIDETQPRSFRLARHKGVLKIACTRNRVSLFNLVNRELVELECAYGE